MKRARGLGDRAEVAVAGLVIGYVALFTLLCLHKYRYFLYKDFDLAIFVQALEQALRGSLFSSIRGMNWLGDHSSLILFPLLPIYAVFRSPVTLLVIQTAALGLGAFPVYQLARLERLAPAAAVGCAALYLLHPAIGFINLFEFHPEALATAPLLAAFCALRAGRLRAMSLWAGLALLCREDVALVALTMALYALVARRERRGRFALALAAPAVVSIVISFGLLKPAFNAGQAEYGRMYEAWGTGPGAILLAMLRRPLDVVLNLVSTPGSPGDSLVKAQYYLHLLLPLGFLPLLSPLTLLIALPVLAEHMLSVRGHQHAIVFQYAALVMPFAMAATVLGLARLERWMARLRAAAEATPARFWLDARGALAIAVLAALSSQVMFGPMSRLGILRKTQPTEAVFAPPYDRLLAPAHRRMLERASRQEGVVAGFEFLPHLAPGTNVHSLHHLLRGSFTFSDRPYPVPSGIHSLVGDMSVLLTFMNMGSADRLQELCRVNRLRPVDVAGDLVLFAREARDTVELYRMGHFPIDRSHGMTYDGQLVLLAWDDLPAELEGGATLTLGTYWRRVATADRLFMMQLALFDEKITQHYQHVRPLGYGFFPVHRWPADTTVREVTRLVVPDAFRPGTYEVVLRMVWHRDPEERGVAIPDNPAVRAQDNVLTLGRVRIRARGGRN